MKKSRFTDEQIAFALKQAETGTRIDEICRKMGISDATFYKWRQKYGGVGQILCGRNGCSVALVALLPTADASVGWPVDKC